MSKFSDALLALSKHWNELDLSYMSDALSAIAAQAQELERDAERWRTEINIARFDRAPCYICGYNGEGYYQPEQHTCAAFLRAAIDKERRP
jgi:hypothetical protein